MGGFGHTFQCAGGYGRGCGSSHRCHGCLGDRARNSCPADEVAEMHPSELSAARADAARAEVARTRDVFNEALAAVGIGPFLADEGRGIC